MTIYSNPVTGPVLGQPISPSFGVQNAGTPVANPIVNPVPLAATIGGTNKTLLEACSRGELPRNAQLATIAGVAVSAGISVLQGDGVSVDEAFSSGNGMQVNGGVAVAPNAGNPGSITTAGVNNQVFVEGNANANDSLSTGPAPTNNESIVSAPLAGSTTVANIGLLTGIYQG
jgi:hypothetical protein